MDRIPQPEDITLTVPQDQAEKICQGLLPFEVLLEVAEISNWLVINKLGHGDIFVTCEPQTFNLIHWLKKGENLFVLKISNAAPGPFVTTLRSRIGDQPPRLLLSLRRSMEVPCVITRTLVVTSPADFTQSGSDSAPPG